MLALLPLLAFGSILSTIFSRRSFIDFRYCFLLSCIVWGIAALIIAEALSLLQLLSPFWITTSWAVLTICFLAAKLRLPFEWKIPPLEKMELFAIYFIGIISITIGVTAWLAPPNTFDSLTYHMSRVAHWAQNNTVANYPTSIPRQLNYTPWAEFAILHFQILSDSDRLANFIQWFAMIGSFIGISGITRLLGGDRKTQIIAVLIAATIPMGILQGSSTQNDYVATFWMVTFVFFLLQLEQNNWAWKTLLPAGLAFGLALLTKGYIYIYAIPFLLFCMLRHKGKNFPQIILLFIIALTLSIGYFSRNWQYTQTLLPPSESDSIINHYRTIGAFLSITVRNIMMHFFGLLEPINQIIQSSVNSIHHLLGIAIDDPRTTHSHDTFKYYNFIFHEDQANNPFHVLLIISSFLGITFTRKIFSKHVLFFGVSVLSAFLLQCLLLKWTPFHSRYHLGLFVLSTPLIALFLNTQKKQLTHLIIIFICIACIPWLIRNESRPLIGAKSILTQPRDVQYFANREGREYGFRDIVETIKEQKCDQVGIIAGADDWEYPFWALAKQLPFSVRFEHVFLNTVSSPQISTYPLGDFEPCMLADITNIKETHITILNKKFTKVNLTNFSQTYLEDSDGLLNKQSTSRFFLLLSVDVAGFLKTIHQNNIFENTALYEKVVHELWKLDKYIHMIDPILLKKTYPNLHIYYENLLVKGLHIIKPAIENKDKKEYAKALSLLFQWQSWLEANFPKIKESFRNL